MSFFGGHLKFCRGIWMLGNIVFFQIDWKFTYEFFGSHYEFSDRLRTSDFKVQKSPLGFWILA